MDGDHALGGDCMRMNKVRWKFSKVQWWVVLKRDSDGVELINEELLIHRCELMSI